LNEDKVRSDVVSQGEKSINAAICAENMDTMNEAQSNDIGGHNIDKAVYEIPIHDGSCLSTAESSSLNTEVIF
jgi:hypothetical protein